MHLSHVPVGTGEAGPPIANRGVGEPQTPDNIQTNPLSCLSPGRVSIDWLTYTLRSDRAAQIIGRYDAMSERAGLTTKAGGAIRGFRQSENRACLGGWFWRRWDPVTESNMYGDSYESWEASGDAAGGLASDLRATPGYATRADVAFDYFGGKSMETLKPEHVIMPQVKPESISDNPKIKMKTNEGFIVGFRGEGGCNTGYVGTRSSDRMVRLYRKDQQSEGFADWLGPCLRTEIELRGEHAKAFWAIYRDDPDQAYRAAAAHIEAMLGVNPMPGGTVPELPAPPELSEVDSLYAFITQTAAREEAYRARGIDLGRLRHLRVSNLGQQALDRLEAIERRLRAIDPDALESRVAAMLIPQKKPATG